MPLLDSDYHPVTLRAGREHDDDGKHARVGLLIVVIFGGATALLIYNLLARFWQWVMR